MSTVTHKIEDLNPILLKHPEFKDLFTQYTEKNQYPVQEAITRNILFVGNSRIGKTTLFNVLKDVTFLSGTSSIFAETKEPVVHTISIKHENTNYVLNLIDTPGMCETTQSDKFDDYRTNNFLRKLIKKCLQSEIKHIHAIFFVCSFKSGLDQQQVNSFIKFTKMFEGAEDKFAMVITKAEDFTSEMKENLILEIEQEVQLKEIVNKIGGRANIYFTGALEKRTVERGFLDALRKKFINISEMRHCIYNYIFESKFPCHITMIKKLLEFTKDVSMYVKNFEAAHTLFLDNISQKKFKEANQMRGELESLRKDVEDNLHLFSENNEKELKTFNHILTSINDTNRTYVIQLLQCEINDFIQKKSSSGQFQYKTKSFFELAVQQKYIESVIESVKVMNKAELLNNLSNLQQFNQLKEN